MEQGKGISYGISLHSLNGFHIVSLCSRLAIVHNQTE
jgi:hypothetical protein